MTDKIKKKKQCHWCDKPIKGDSYWKAPAYDFYFHEKCYGLMKEDEQREALGL